MQIIVEKNIPFIRGLLEPYGTVSYLSAQDIDREAVREADALFVRTRTRCDAALLEGSKCKFIATATIGTDHIDLPWCADNGIEVVNAPGCNAPAVAQYVFAGLLRLINRPISQYTIGIVGVGHVGRIVEYWAKHLNMNVLLNDPPRQARERAYISWSSLEQIAQSADIITFHTPLDKSTLHLADKDFFDSLRRSPIIINAARGPVVDNGALNDALIRGQVQHAIIDCWENEPDISLDLLRNCSIATPHIAGYSYEGKVRGTQMVLDAFCRHFGLNEIIMKEVVPDDSVTNINLNAISASYNPMKDTYALRSEPAAFESLRNNYSLRHEVGND